MKKTLVKYPYLTKEVEIYERENGHKIVLAHKEGDMVMVRQYRHALGVTEYEICAGNIVWSVLTAETIVGPVLLTGLGLYEPVDYIEPKLEK